MCFCIFFSWGILKWKEWVCKYTCKDKTPLFYSFPTEGLEIWSLRSLFFTLRCGQFFFVNSSNSQTLWRSQFFIMWIRDFLGSFLKNILLLYYINKNLYHGPSKLQRNLRDGHSFAVWSFSSGLASTWLGDDDVKPRWVGVLEHLLHVCWCSCTKQASLKREGKDLSARL